MDLVALRFSPERGGCARGGGGIQVVDVSEEDELLAARDASRPSVDLSGGVGAYVIDIANGQTPKRLAKPQAVGCVVPLDRKQCSLQLL